MGNIDCSKLNIMDEKFDEKKTIKVSGISQLLREQLTKELQKKKNSIKYKDDVNKLHVCPKGNDYVLVEFVNDIQSKFSNGFTARFILFTFNSLVICIIFKTILTRDWPVDIFNSLLCM